MGGARKGEKKCEGKRESGRDSGDCGARTRLLVWRLRDLVGELERRLEDLVDKQRRLVVVAGVDSGLLRREARERGGLHDRPPRRERQAGDRAERRDVCALERDELREGNELIRIRVSGRVEACARDERAAVAPASG